MKHFYLFLMALLFLTAQLKAQAPNSLNYQGVVRNASGIVIPNQNISLRFTVHQGTATGTVVYKETQSATTNSLGLYTVAIGLGTVVSGNFSTIAWTANAEFLQVEIDPLGGTTYLNAGTNQFLTVPYALNAGSSASGWNLTGNSSTNGTDYIGTTDANDLVFKTDANTNPNPNIEIANGTGNVGINTAAPVNTLDVNGSKAIGTYAGAAPAAPANGLIVSGQVGIGTNTPNAGAALDITSSSKGLLIPRMATNPANPSQSMMYYNTTTGCFMYYSGTAWNSIVCPCPNNPSTPGAISGPTTFCPALTGVVYSVAPVSNASSYSWSVPAATGTITGGQGTNAITVTMGTTSGAITVAGVNNCGTGATSSLSVTAGTALSITTQPLSLATTTGAPVTFTVAATGTSLGYQWQVNTGSGFNNIGGATTASLTVSGVGLVNGNQYRVLVTGTGPCSPATSNVATLSVCSSSTPSVKITVQNTQSVATPTNFAQMLTLNSSNYASYESTGLTNVIFTTGPDGTGTPLQAWIESGNTTASTATIYWVNLASNTIPANSTLNIYMSFTGTGLSATGPTGEAPQLSGTTTPTYGSLDNGALVFPEFYDNFAGTTLSSNWSKAGAEDGTPVINTTVNNGLSFTLSGSTHPNWYGIYETKFSAALNNVADSYCSFGSGGGISITTTGNAITGSLVSNGVNGGAYPSDGFDAQLTAGGGNNYSIANHGSCQTAPSANSLSVNTGSTPVAGTFYTFSFYMVYPPIDYVNYGAFSTYNAPIDANSAGCSISPTSEVGLGVSAAAGTFQWFRIRPCPPNNVTPSFTATFGCF